MMRSDLKSTMQRIEQYMLEVDAAWGALLVLVSRA
jgi:hypothetical protein